jgi:hypothetical protein
VDLARKEALHVRAQRQITSELLRQGLKATKTTMADEGDAAADDDDEKHRGVSEFDQTRQQIKRFFFRASWDRPRDP